MSVFIAMQDSDKGFKTPKEVELWIAQQLHPSEWSVATAEIGYAAKSVTKDQKDAHRSVLTEAEGLVHGDRNEDYGHPLDDFKRTAAMWSALLGTEVSSAQVGLCMIAVKLSRECHRPKRDNLVDAAGYAETVAWCNDEQYRRETAMETFSPIKAGGTK